MVRLCWSVLHHITDVLVVFVMLHGLSCDQLIGMDPDELEEGKGGAPRPGGFPIAQCSIIFVDIFVLA
jgi:hypothetical protein